MLPHHWLWRALWPRTFLATLSGGAFWSQSTLSTVPRFTARSRDNVKKATCVEMLIRLGANCLIQRKGESGPFCLTLAYEADNLEREKQPRSEGEPEPTGMRTGIPGSPAHASQAPWEDIPLLFFQMGMQRPWEVKWFAEGHRLSHQQNPGCERRSV